MAVTAFVAVGIIMAGWASNNKCGLLGGMRSAAQIVSYEIPSGLALLAVVLTAGTMSTQGIIREKGWLPWTWNVSARVSVRELLHLLHRRSGRDQPHPVRPARRRVGAGRRIQHRVQRHAFALFFLAEWADLYVISAIATLAFLAGWQVPGFVPESLRSLAQVLAFVCKAFFLGS